jgi:hypothetical protein
MEGSAMNITIEKIDPDRARQMLGTNEANRRMRMHQVIRLAEVIRRGEWRSDNGETIKVSKTGRLVDGQHRLSAIVKAGVPVEVAVAWGVEDSAVDTIDIGMRRTAGDYLTMNGVPQGNSAAAAAVMIMRYDIHDFPRLHERRPTVHQVVRFVEENTALPRALNVGYQVRRALPTNKTIASTSYFLFARIDVDDADLFFDALITGADLSERDPVLTLRNRLLKESTASRKLEGDNIFALYVKAWNAYRNDQEPRILVWKNDEPFPRAV